MLKILVGVDGRTISDYFGHSKQFIVFDVVDGQIIKEAAFDNPGHTLLSSPPKFVPKLGVSAVIGGTVGRIAFNIMKKRGINVIAGAYGDSREAVDEYLKGMLVLDESAIEMRASPLSKA